MAFDPFRTGRWQTLRATVTAADTPLSTYQQSEITANNVHLLKSIYPADVIGIRLFGQDGAADTVTVLISGWMEPGDKAERDPGPGFRLWSGIWTLSGQSRTQPPILNSPVDWPPGTYLEGIVTTTTYDTTTGDAPLGAATREGLLILPTLNFRRILVEITAMTGSTRAGLIWRPLSSNNTVIGL